MDAMHADGSVRVRDADSGSGSGRVRVRVRGTGRVGDGTASASASAMGRRALAIDGVDDAMARAIVASRRFRRIVVGLGLGLGLASADAVEARARAIAHAGTSAAGRVRGARTVSTTMCTTTETARVVIAIEMIVEAATGEDDATARSRAPSRAPRTTAARPHPRVGARDIDLDDATYHHGDFRAISRRRTRTTHRRPARRASRARVRRRRLTRPSLTRARLRPRLARVNDLHMSIRERDDVVEAVSGAAGALCALLATYPLITLNARQHVARRTRDASAPEARAAAVNVWSLFDGIEPAIVGTVASQAVYNYWYSRLTRAGRARTGGDAVEGVSSLAIASAAGVMNVLMTLPIWTIVTKMQAEVRGKTGEREGESGEGTDGETASARDAAVDAAISRARGSGKRRRRSFFQVAREVVRESGVRGLWQGLTPSLVMVANPALQYAFYESAARWRMRHSKRRALTAGEIFVLGASAKFGATILTYPLLVVKTRLQVISKDMADNRMRYRGAAHAIRSMAADEGLGVFYKGIETKLAQTMLAAALMFTVKEKLSEGVYKARAVVAPA